MTAAEYRAALAALNLTQVEAAKALDLSLRTCNSYANGAPIPKVVDLALKYLKSKKRD